MENTIAFKMKIKNGAIDEYRLRQEEIRRRLTRSLAGSGQHDCSIFLDEETDTLFAIHKSRRNLPKERDPLLHAWTQVMGELLETDAEAVTSTTELRELFHFDPDGDAPLSSRGRTLRAFGMEPGLPDRPPLQFDLCRSLIREFSARRGIEPDFTDSYFDDLSCRISANRLRVELGSDVVVVGAAALPAPAAGGRDGAVYLNEFGMEIAPGDPFCRLVRPPLAGDTGSAAIGAYRFPDPLHPDRYEKARRDIEAYRESHFVVGDCELSLFELAWRLTGMEKYLISMAMREAWVEELNDRIEAWTLAVASRLTEMGVDAIWFGEDLGTDETMLLSPEIWRERFKPRYARMIAVLRGINPELKIIMHSDGAVAPLIEDFIEIGIDVYNPVQPNVPGANPRELKRRYGDRINFFGGIDQQELLPSGDLEALEEEIVHRAEVMGAGGGYLMAPAHIVGPSTTPEQVEAMIRIIQSLA